MDVLIIYQFCTFGGVERAILNRAKTFQKHNLRVNISMGYLYDYGALQSFQDYIHANDLDDCMTAFLITEDAFPDLCQYDLILNIDTPQIFELTLHAKNIYVECHTPYIENRQYLKAIPQNTRGIIVPSESFRELVESEFPDLPPVFVLPNPVSEEFFEIQSSNEADFFSKRPITYFARLDELKNFSEAANIFELFTSTEEIMFLVIGNGADNELMINSLEQKSILEKTLLRDRLDFDKAPSLVNLVRRHHGIFISPSKGESFGLSAAEFISGGVPVLLSDIPAHKELVNNDGRFLYELGNTQSAESKIRDLLRDWEGMHELMKTYSNKFKGDAFINAWQRLIEVKN